MAAAGIRLPGDVAVLASAVPDDVLDAAVAAWSAHRVATGSAVCLPNPPEIDDLGRRVAICY